MNSLLAGRSKQNNANQHQETEYDHHQEETKLLQQSRQQQQQQKERTGHVIIPRDISLPGTASSLLLIFVEESLSTPEEKRTARDERGLTCLHIAVLKACPISFVEELIVNYDIDVNCVDYEGNTPLHLSASVKAHEHTKLLLAHGADANVMNGDGQTPETDFLNREYSVHFSPAASPNPVVLGGVANNNNNNSSNIFSTSVSNNFFGQTTTSSMNVFSSFSNQQQQKDTTSSLSPSPNRQQHLPTGGKPHVVTRENVIFEKIDEPHYRSTVLISERISLFGCDPDVLLSLSEENNNPNQKNGLTRVASSSSFLLQDAKKHQLLIQEASKVANMEIAVPLVPTPWHAPPVHHHYTPKRRSTNASTTSSPLSNSNRKSSTVRSMSMSQMTAPPQQQQQEGVKKSSAVFLVPNPPTGEQQQQPRKRNFLLYKPPNVQAILDKARPNSSATTTSTTTTHTKPATPHPLESRGQQIMNRYFAKDDGENEDDAEEDLFGFLGKNDKKKINDDSSDEEDDEQTKENDQTQQKEEDEDDDDIFKKSKQFYEMMDKNKKQLLRNISSQQQRQRRKSSNHFLLQSLPVWFTVIPRVSEHELATSFLVGGMVRFHNEFQFDGMPFTLAETQMYPEIFCARFASTLSAASPRRENDDFEDENDNDESQYQIVLELFTSNSDTSLPTIVRCFRDPTGTIGFQEKRKLLQREAVVAKKRAQLAAKHEAADKADDAAVMIQTSEAKAALLLMRFMRRLLYLGKFQNIIFLFADKILKVKRFLRRCVHRSKFTKSILYFIAASFFRYVLSELARFPKETGGAVYRGIGRVVRGFVETFSDQRFVSKSLLYIAIDQAFIHRKQKLMHLLKKNRNVPLASYIENFRERYPWSISMEEIVHYCIEPMGRRELLPMISVAETRDGMLPRVLLYHIRQLPNAREMFEDLSRSKVKRTLMDMVQTFRGRKSYLEERVSVFTHNDDVQETISPTKVRPQHTTTTSRSSPLPDIMRRPSPYLTKEEESISLEGRRKIIFEKFPTSATTAENAMMMIDYENYYTNPNDLANNAAAATAASAAFSGNNNSPFQQQPRRISPILAEQHYVEETLQSLTRRKKSPPLFGQRVVQGLRKHSGFTCLPPVTPRRRSPISPLGKKKKKEGF